MRLPAKWMNVMVYSKPEDLGRFKMMVLWNIAEAGWDGGTQSWYPGKWKEKKNEQFRFWRRDGCQRGEVVFQLNDRMWRHPLDAGTC